MSSQVTERIKEIALPIASEVGVRLAEVEYKKEGQDWFLRIFLDDATKSVDVDTCSLVSERISKVLDEIDPISTAYYLEVCSKGIERRLKGKSEIQSAIGSNVVVRTYEPIEGEKVFRGSLVDYNDEYLSVKTEDAFDVRLPTAKVSEIKLDAGI